MDQGQVYLLININPLLSGRRAGIQMDGFRCHPTLTYISVLPNKKSIRVAAEIDRRDEDVCERNTGLAVGFCYPGSVYKYLSFPNCFSRFICGKVKLKLPYVITKILPSKEGCSPGRGAGPFSVMAVIPPPVTFDLGHASLLKGLQRCYLTLCFTCAGKHSKTAQTLMWDRGR